MSFFPRHARSEGDEPLALSQIQADDALIEALRQTPLFDDGSTGPGPDDRFAAADTLAFSRADLVVGAAAFDSSAPTDSDARVAAMLRAWQQEIDSVPMPPPIDLQAATAVVRAAPLRRRAMRPMIAVACAITGLLVGSAAIGARSATPENVLWPVTQMLWGDRADSVLAAIDVRKGIAEASRALVADNPDGAEVALDYVTSVITRVEPRDGRTTLESDLSNMQSQLESATGETIPSTAAATTAPTNNPTTDSTATSPASTTSATSATTPSTTSTPPTTSAAPTTTSPPLLPPPPSTTDTTTPTTETSNTTTSDPTTTETTPTTSATTEVTTETTMTTSDTTAASDPATTADTPVTAQATVEIPLPAVSDPVSPTDVALPTV